MTFGYFKNPWDFPLPRFTQWVNLLTPWKSARPPPKSPQASGCRIFQAPLGSCHLLGDGLHTPHGVAWRGMAWHPNGGDRWEFIGARWQWFSEFSLGCAFGITIWCICLSQDVYVVWYVFCASVGSNGMSLELGTLKIKQKLKILMPKTLWANETTSRTWRKTFGATSPWRSNPNIKRASQLNMLLPHTTFLWQLVPCCLDIPQPNSDRNDVWWIPLNEHRCGQYTISRSFS